MWQTSRGGTRHAGAGDSLVDDLVADTATALGIRGAPGLESWSSWPRVFRRGISWPGVGLDQEHPAVQDVVVDQFQVGGCHVREGRPPRGPGRPARGAIQEATRSSI